MKSKCKTAAITLAAVAMLVALTAQTALAAKPEFLKKGSINVLPLKSEFGSTRFETVGAWPFWTFSSENKFSGEAAKGASTKTIENVSLTFKHGNESSACTSEGTTLVLAGLKGKLGYINKTEKTVGVRFDPVKEPIVKCTGFFGPHEIVGGVIAKITPVNEPTTKLKLTFSQTSGVQKPLWLEGETEKFPETFPLTIAKKWHCTIIGGKEICEIKEGEHLAFENESTINIEVSETVEISA